MDIRVAEQSEISDFFDRQFNSYSLLKKHKTSNYKTWAFAAYVNNKLVAAIKGEIFWSVTHIDLLIVDSEYRKQGIGTKLYEKVCEISPGKITVETFDFQAPKFWINHGFKVDFTRSGYEDNTLYYLSK